VFLFRKSRSEQTLELLDMAPSSEAGDVTPWRWRAVQKHLSVYGSTALCWVLAAFSVTFIIYTVGRTPWKGDQPVARPLPAHRTAQTQNKRTQTSIPQVGFEPTIPMFERAKTVHALDRATTVIGSLKPSRIIVVLSLGAQSTCTMRKTYSSAYPFSCLVALIA
jgi:hypothetical protein